MLCTYMMRPPGGTEGTGRVVFEARRFLGGGGSRVDGQPPFAVEGVYARAVQETNETLMLHHL